jgi:hypothetical protein
MIDHTDEIIHGTIVPGKHRGLYFKFDDDEPILINDYWGNGNCSITLMPDGGDMTFTDNKGKRLKLFIREVKDER